jgi:hypothetical protein
MTQVTKGASSRADTSQSTSAAAAKLETDLASSTRAFVDLCAPKKLDMSTVGGWHGTSEAALRLAMSLGGLRGSPISHARAAAGHLFFFKPEPCDFVSGTDLSLQPLGRGGAEGYASLAEQNSRLMQALGLNFKNSNHHYVSMELSDVLQEDPKKGRTELQKLGLKEQAITELLSGFWERRGFLVAISKPALERYRITNGDVPGEDYKIFLPNVLKFSEMAAIIPVGEQEKRWVAALTGTLSAPDPFEGLATGIMLPQR